jgi:ABC-2 type transport system ATP-binding protein
VIETVQLSKQFGTRIAVNQVTFRALPGQVTALAGPHRAGKSTLIAILLGLLKPSAGRALINGKPFAAHADPLHQAGAVLQEPGADPVRRVRDHLRILATTQDIPKNHVEDLIAVLGLNGTLNQRISELPAGPRNRLNLAVALLGDPQTLILDDVLSRVDDESAAIIRDVIGYLADQGRTVLIAGDRINDLAGIASHLVVMNRGSVTAELPMIDLVRDTAGPLTRVVTINTEKLTDLLLRAGAVSTTTGPNSLQISGLPTAQIGEIAAAHGIALHELTPITVNLDDRYRQLLVTGSLETSPAIPERVKR